MEATTERYRIIQGDCLEVMPTLPAESVDAIVTDPPYGLSFMGKDWDHGVPGVPFWEAALRVAKPGAHMLAFGGTRTYHRLACAIEDAGWEIRDCIMWVYGSGFPKSLDVSKAIDKEAGAGAARQWHGWGTALKPSYEPVIVARKPLVGTVAKNVQTHGTGALNIDGCRVECEPISTTNGSMLGRISDDSWDNTKRRGTPFVNTQGRWPANLIHDGSDEVVALFPQSAGQQGDVRGTEPSRTGGEGTNCYGEYGRIATQKRGDSGSAARFFYSPKASKAERNGSGHPTIKPLALMRYLVRLVTPPDGIVLDPFAGSGTTIQAALEEHCQAIGIELSEEYCADIHRRVPQQTLF